MGRTPGGWSALTLSDGSGIGEPSGEAVRIDRPSLLVSIREQARSGRSTRQCSWRCCRPAAAGLARADLASHSSGHLHVPEHPSIEPCRTHLRSKPASLWPHQRDALSVVSSFLRPRRTQGFPATLIRMPTGTGKRRVIAVAAHGLVRDGDVLVLTPWDVLVDQLTDDIHRRFPDPRRRHRAAIRTIRAARHRSHGARGGSVWDSRWSAPSPPPTGATVAARARRRRSRSGIELPLNGGRWQHRPARSGGPTLRLKVSRVRVYAPG